MKKFAVILALIAMPVFGQLTSARFTAHAAPDDAFQDLALNGSGAIAAFPSYAQGALSWMSVQAPLIEALCDLPLGGGLAPPISCYPTSGSRMARLKTFESFFAAYIFIGSLPEKKTAFMVRRPGTSRWYVVYEQCVDFYACTPGPCFECP